MTTPSPSASTVATMGVLINDKVVTVPAGSTLGHAIQVGQIPVRAGRLLDVDGEVIRPNEYPAHFVVDGKRAIRETELAPGSVVVITDGRDHTEDTEEERRPVTSPQPANPERTLGNAPGEEIITRGVISGKIESIEFAQDRLGKHDVPKAVALTFDDGPSQYTDRVLDILRKEEVPATFFVVGYLAERDPNAIRAIVTQGHAVGNHSWSHPLTSPFAQLEERQLVNQLERTNEALADIGVEPVVFRPPGGSYNATVIEAARRLGMRNVVWSIDTHDFQASTTPKGLIKTVLQQLRPGAIILMHDGGGDQSATVAALPRLIKEIRKRGYGFVKLGEDV